ncbi:BDNF/NT-3 growth factors receptor [Nymphon striatum]|nr:BDNF/NT-3 growth factors receptor [Nymphon striatum]
MICFLFMCRMDVLEALKMKILGKSGLKMDGKHATNPNYYTIQDDISFIKQMQIFEIPRHKIAFISKIGEGYFGEVYKGSYMKECPDIGMLVAIKILKNNVNTEACSDFEREVETLSSFDHKNIVKLLGVVTQDTTEIPWMVFEYMRYGDLTEFLRQGSPTSIKNVYRLVQSDLLFIARQIASGMVYLSEQHFVHRDLATRNCLVGDGLSVKISDFGLSRDIYTCDYYKIGGSRMLPVRWMAPESVVYGKFTLQSDAWSFGVVLWEIFVYGKQPYYGHSNDQVVKMILQEILLDASEGCPPLISSIMKACWKIDPNDRLTFPEIYKLLSTNFNQIKKSGELLEIENYLVPDLHLSIN